MTNGGVNWACSFGDESGGRDGDEGCCCNGRGAEEVGSTMISSETRFNLNIEIASFHNFYI